MPTDPRPARSAPARGRACLLLVALVAVGACGCSQPAQASAGAEVATQTPHGAGASTQALADGSSFLVSEPANAFPQAIVSGRLALIGGNCVGLENPGSGETSALAFPHGTRPSDDGHAIVLPDGVQIALGDSITGGGGYTTLSESPDAFTSWPDAPSGCAKATYAAGIYDVTITQGQ